MNPFNCSKRSAALLLLGCAGLFVAQQQAKAFVVDASFYAPVSGVVTASAGAASAPWLASALYGFTAPIVAGTAIAVGISAAIGAGIYGGYLLGNYGGEKIGAFVSARTLDVDPFPGLNLAAATPAPPPPTGYAGFVLNFLNNPYTQVYTSYKYNVALTYADAERMTLGADDLLAAYGFKRNYSDLSGVPVPAGSQGNVTNSTSGVCIGYCFQLYYDTTTPAGYFNTKATGTLPPGVLMSSVGGSTQKRAIWFPLTTAYGTICTLPNIYDTVTGLCAATYNGELIAPSNTGQCRVGWTPSGLPYKNPLDGDCDKFQVTIVPGTSTTPPTVVIKDPAPDGGKLTVARPAIPGQSTLPPGAVKVITEIPNPATGTTEVATATTAAPSVPGGAPVATGAGKAIYPGVGSTVGSTPVGQVDVANFPTSMRCENCVPVVNVAPAQVTVNTPDTIKIDSEGALGEADAPDTDAEAAALPDPTTLLDTVKTRLNPLSTFSVPTHAGTCPSINLNFNWFGAVSVQNDTLCSTLESPEVKGLFQGIFRLGYTLGAIIIVLGA